MREGTGRMDKGALTAEGLRRVSNKHACGWSLLSSRSEESDKGEARSE